jgi:hypothetical protein
VIPGTLLASRYLQKVIWPYHAAPHMRDRRSVKPQTFFGLSKVAPDYVGKIIYVYYNPFFKRIQII